ncbi:pathogenesis-related family protein [Actinidia rufa]|uniref:Pathogenesis-related family protein n=1 Tax=Actinidia rufa TaxID=165716 RepID=A0A7J0EGQ1_9ERIC|nr:pathogenesis-related family protein [Actinidia rufa]
MSTSSGTTPGDKYRSYLDGEEEKNTKWRFGAAPNYDVVNKLFEEGGTKCKNLVKSWEMELFHKASLVDFKTLDPNKAKTTNLGRNSHQAWGRVQPAPADLLAKEVSGYDPDEDTAESSHKAFITTFPRGFALEVLQVYSGPPVIVYKFRHWGFMEGPFKGHTPTGEMVEFYGMAIFELDEHSKIVKVEFFYDRGELLGGLLKGATSDVSKTEIPSTSSCPFLKNTG